MKLPFEQRVTLKLGKPGRLAWLIPVIFILLALALECLARTTWVQSRVPFQAYGSNHVQYEYQLKQLNAYTAKHEAPDCFILGNSQSFRGIEPETLASAYQDETGQPLSCYNFSIVGSNISTTSLFARMLVEEYHPKLFILGTSFLDYTESRENRFDPRFEENAWIDYRLGDWSLRGWLLEHSFAFRLVTLASYSAPSGLDFTETKAEVEKWQEQITPLGYGYSEKTVNLGEALKPGFVKNFVERFGDFSLSRRNLEGLEAIIELSQQSEVQIVVVEMPFHPILLDLQDEQGQPLPENLLIAEFVKHATSQISRITSQHRTLFYRTESLDIPDNGWHDHYHLNTTSGKIFTRWLAEQIAQAVRNRQLGILTAK